VATDERRRALSTSGSLLTHAGTVVYPESDGLPMAENTLQFEWISTLKWGYEALFRDEPQVFVAGDLLWYPVEGEPGTRTAPDVLVAFGRPKGYRGSYRQWEEGGVGPQVVFEVLSPGNTKAEMIDKFLFYDEYGVEEYYVYDPDREALTAYVRGQATLAQLSSADGFVSPRLGIRFDMSRGTLRVYRPDGQVFRSFEEVVVEAEQAKRGAEQAKRETEQARREAEQARRETDQEKRGAEQARREAEQARQQVEQARQQVEQAEERARRLAEKLRSLGIDPNV
jgi:Uma2 family endonuclease